MKKEGVTIKKCKHPRYSWRVTYRQGDAYVQRYFTTQDEAKAFAAEKRVELLNEGRKHGELSDEERRAVIRSREIAERFEREGVREFSLDSAIDHFARYLSLRKRSMRVLNAFDEFTETRRREGVSAAHLNDFTYKLQKFARSFGDTFVSDIETAEIDRWLFGLKCAPQTRLNHRRVLGNFFSYCESRGYCDRNPVDRAAKVKVIAKPPGILSPTETASLLAHCSGEILPAVAIALFGGLRRAEIERLDWSEIDLERGFITVTAENAKTARRRLVEIAPNLRDWLAPHVRRSGPVRPSEAIYRDLFEGAREAAGISQWPNNAMRHSFASYHLARGQDASKTALQLGHSGTAVLFEHYRELTRPDEGEAYFGITPESVRPGNVISIGGAAA